MTQIITLKGTDELSNPKVEDSNLAISHSLSSYREIKFRPNQLCEVSSTFVGAPDH